MCGKQKTRYIIDADENSIYLIQSLRPYRYDFLEHES